MEAPKLPQFNKIELPKDTSLEDLIEIMSETLTRLNAMDYALSTVLNILKNKAHRLT